MIETLRTGKSAHVIHEIAGSGFEASYQNIVTYPLIDSHGEIIRIIEIWRDISVTVIKWYALFVAEGMIILFHQKKYHRRNGSELSTRPIFPENKVV